MASPGNQHCANCIGTPTFPIYKQQTKSAKDLTARSASSTLEWMDPRRSEVSLMKSLGSSRGSQGARSAAWTDTKSTSVSTNTLSTLLCGSKNIRLKISVTFFRSASLHARHAEHVSAVPAPKYPLTAHIYFYNLRSLRSRSTLRPRY